MTPPGVVFSTTLPGALPKSAPQDPARAPTPPPYATGLWTPGESGLLAATYDPILGQTGQSIAAGVMRLTRVPINAPITVSNLECNLTGGGAGLAGCFGVIYDPLSGALLAQTVDQAAAFASAGIKAMALPAPVTLTNDVLAGLVTLTATTAPSAGSTTAITAALLNRGGAANNQRALLQTALGAVPNPLPAMTLNTQLMYIGLY